MKRSLVIHSYFHTLVHIQRYYSKRKVKQKKKKMHSCTRKRKRKHRKRSPFSSNSKVYFSCFFLSSFHGKSRMPWMDAKFAEKKEKRNGKRKKKREDEESGETCVPNQPQKREKNKIKRKQNMTFISFNHEIRIILASRRRNQR